MVTLLKMTAVFAFLGLTPAWPGPLGTLVGTIHDDIDKLVPGAFIAIHRVADLVRNELGRTVSRRGDFTATAQPTADGTFIFAGIPGGQYFICGYTAVAGYLSNCEWSTSVQVIQVDEGATVSGVRVTLPRGSVVEIIVTDTRRLINVPSGISAVPTGHYFFPSVRTVAGYYSMARHTAQSGSQHVYTVTIPKSVNVEMFFDTDLLISSPTGLDIPARLPSGISVSGGSNTKVAISVN